MKHKHTHQFPDGTTATLTIIDNPPNLFCEWSQKPTKQLVEEYLQWRDRVLEEHARATGRRMMVVTL